MTPEDLGQLRSSHKHLAALIIVSTTLASLAFIFFHEATIPAVLLIAVIIIGFCATKIAYKIWVIIGSYDSGFYKNLEPNFNQAREDCNRIAAVDSSTPDKKF